MVLIPTGVDPDRFAPATPLAPRGPEPWHIVAVGSVRFVGRVRRHVMPRWYRAGPRPALASPHLFIARAWRWLWTRPVRAHTRAIALET